MENDVAALCVVPCGKAKVWDREPGRGPVAAREAYVGSFATAARAYAEARHAAWVILSAKHGFLLPTDLVPGPYEVTFARRGDPCVTVEVLRRQLGEMRLDRAREVVVVGGRRYVACVRDAFPPSTRIVAPLAGLTSMGAMLAAMRSAVRTGAEPGRR